MEEVCAVGLHQSGQVEEQADEIPQQVAAAEMHISYFPSSIRAALYGYKKLPLALLSLLAGQGAEKRGCANLIFILKIFFAKQSYHLNRKRGGGGRNTSN